MCDWYHLQGRHSSVVLGALDEGVPSIVYWGKQLPSDLDSKELALLISQPSPSGFLDAIPPLSLLPELGRGFHGEAGLVGHANRRHWGGQLQLQPVAEHSSNSVQFICRDDLSGLQVTLTVCLDPTTDVMSVDVTLLNHGEEPFLLDHLGVSLPLPAEADELITFHGRWIQEFLTKRFKWPMHKVVRENHRGKTSHDSFPAMIAGEPGFSESIGSVWGVHLAYSGNHKLVAEKLMEGARHIQCAEWLYPGEVALATGESYSAPTLYASWSGSGLNGLSQQFHRYLRQQVLDLDVLKKPRPVHLNTWEGIYFNHKPEQLLAMVQQAADVGVERFVLDDGWFGKRDDDHAGLGDWFVDERKHPGGLGYLIDAVKQAGMEFGLWFEPEMVNPDSDLFRAHPDWILQVEGYSQPLGRHQYVLNLSRPEVFDYLLERLDWFLTSYDIRYIKWDMNRDLTQPGSLGIASVRNQTHALYRLLAQLRRRHPQCEIETCSSGGGRIDFEILRHTQRIWVSDCNDARERQRIQYAYSLFLPPEIMGSHISENPAHTTKRSHSLGYKLITAMFGHMGLELDVVGFSETERSEVQHLVSLYKTHRTLLHTGDFYRLDIEDPALQAYGVVSEDKTAALFAATTLALQEQMLLPRVRLAGLKPRQSYKVALWIPKQALGPRAKASALEVSGGGVFSAELLQQVGLQLPIMSPDSALLIELIAVKA